MDWTQIILAVLAIISALVTGLLIPYLKSKMSVAQLEKLDYFTRVFVAAAETEFNGEGMGEIKKTWVMERLRDIGMKFDEEAVSAAIEAFVRELTAGGVINGGGLHE